VVVAAAAAWLELDAAGAGAKEEDEGSTAAADEVGPGLLLLGAVLAMLTRVKSDYV